MHELSIALSIVDMAQEESSRRGDVAIRAVHLQLGLLSGVVKDALLASYEMACPQPVGGVDIAKTNRPQYGGSQSEPH